MIRLLIITLFLTFSIFNINRLRSHQNKILLLFILLTMLIQMIIIILVIIIGIITSIINIRIIIDILTIFNFTIHFTHSI